jgi:hypothetical protein
MWYKCHSSCYTIIGQALVHRGLTLLGGQTQASLWGKQHSWVEQKKKKRMF